MRALARRVAAVGRAVDPAPDRAFLAYARAAVAFGGAVPASSEAEAAAVGLARWLVSGRHPCEPG